MQPAPLKITDPVRILVDRRKAVGDVVMITPLLRELRKRYGPDAYIQVVTEETFVLNNYSTVNSVVHPNEIVSADPWDLYVNLNDAYENNVTSHYVEAYLYRAFGENIADIDRTLDLVHTEEEKSNVDEVLEQIGENYIVVHMRRWAWENKNVTPETWTVMFAWLEAAYPDTKIVSVGSQYDLHAPSGQGPRYVDLNEQLSIGEIKYLISHAKCFVGGDSGPYHIAATTKTPIIALLTHLAPEQILPWRDGEFGKDVQVVQSRVPCLGCYARQKPPVRALVCENTEQWACNKSFSVEDITQALDNILKAD
jgi:ADP-heptose:LPS heptosyltransferase